MEATAARLTREDYERAKHLLVEHAARRDDIAACWQYGEVSQPGISDLDVILVVKDAPRPGVAEHLRKEALPELVCAAMAHANLIVVPESRAEGVFYWDDLRVSDMATGRKVTPPALEIGKLRLAMLVDWTFERTYRLLRMRQAGAGGGAATRRSAETGLQNRRLSLGMLKSYGYCIENFKTLAPERDWSLSDALKAELLDLRGAWLFLNEVEQQRRLESLFNRTCAYAQEILGELHAFIDGCGAYPRWEGPANDFDFVFPDGMVLRFVDRLPADFPSADGRPVIPVPKRLLHHFAAYLRPEAALSRKLRASFRPPVESWLDDRGFSGAYAEFLAQRMEHCNDWFDFLKRAGFNYGLFKYGWYLNT